MFPLMGMENVGIIRSTARQDEESEDCTTCWGRMGTTHQGNHRSLPGGSSFMLLGNLALMLARLPFPFPTAAVPTWLPSSPTSTHSRETHIFCFIEQTDIIRYKCSRFSSFTTCNHTHPFLLVSWESYNRLPIHFPSPIRSCSSL